MPRSMFEIQVSILNVLAMHGPLKQSHIMYKTNINCNYLKQLIDQLISNGLIEEQKQKKRNKIYSITRKGQKVIEYAKKINNILPVMEPTVTPMEI